MSVAPYPEYRSSPLTPTGVAPKHWLDGAVKRGFRITLGKMVVASNENDDRTTQPYLRSANVQDGWLALDDVKEMYFSPTEAASLSLLEGDLVICEGGDVGRCALLRESLEGYGFQNSINRARGIGDNCTAYLAYWLSHLKNNGFIDVLCNKSTIAHYTAEKLANTPMLMPTPGEQSAIAAFLDQETGKIDALVAEQERLIALLKEKRQAVVSHAVTKGLNPNAPMKDSGIEWLGQVPAHWEVKRIGALFAEANQEGELDLPVLSVSIHDGVSDRELADEELDRKVSRSEDRTKYKKVQPGDLVYNMMRAWQGGFGTVTVHGMVSPAYVVARPQDFVRAAFIEMLLRTPFAVEEMRRHSRGVTDFRLRLYWDEFKQINVPVPTTDEQDQILLGVQEIMAQGDTLITEATQAITLLRERRAALISAAVTGKIDVRSLAPTKQEAA